MNLLAETIEFLKAYNKTLNDILWFGTKSYKISNVKLEDFLNVEYDNGFGAQEIAWDLILVGSDFYLSRTQYDGSENWEISKHPELPKEERYYKLCREVKYGWSTLEEVNS